MIESIHAPSLAAILPESILRDEKLLASAKALDKELAKLSEAVIETLHLPRIDELPEHVVDLLGWQFHVENYGMSLPLEVKRELVKTSILVHRKKGTRYAIETTVSQFFSPVEAVPWHEYGGHPFTFRLNFQSYEGFSEERGIAFLRKIVNDVKSERDRLGYTGEAVISFERTIELDGPIRLGIATARGGFHHISPALPEDQKASLLMSLMPWRTGIRRIEASTNEFTEPLAFAARFGLWRGGRVDIAADEDDLPQWYKDVWTSRMAPAVGFGARIKGVQRLAPMPPDTEAGRILIRSAMHMAGIRQYGLAPPEDSMAVLRTGILLSANGKTNIHADADDIAAVRSRILDDGIIVPRIGIAERRSGKHHIGLDEPEQAAFMLATGFFHTISGRTDIRAAPEDLPQGPDSILDPAKGILRLGIKETRHGRRIYAVERFDDSAAGIGIGIEGRQRKRNTIRAALPDDSAASIAIGTAGAIGGRQRISADAGDVPDWYKDVLDGSVAAFRIGSIETFRKHRERIAPEFPEESGDSLGVGTITARTGRREIAAEKSDIPSHDILKTSKAEVYFSTYSMWNGKTVISPAPEESHGGETRMRIGMGHLVAGRIVIRCDPDDLRPVKAGILSHVGLMHVGALAVG